MNHSQNRLLCRLAEVIHIITTAYIQCDVQVFPSRESMRAGNLLAKKQVVKASHKTIAKVLPLSTDTAVQELQALLPAIVSPREKACKCSST